MACILIPAKRIFLVNAIAGVRQRQLFIHRCTRFIKKHGLNELAGNLSFRTFYIYLIIINLFDYCLKIEICIILPCHHLWALSEYLYTELSTDRSTTMWLFPLNAPANYFQRRVKELQ
jgi:hypothetical protein